ncbi:MAG: hypothetical protein KGI33_06880 [Thaumarchaeota archaeon]|nr:hypothetical protein [Nitrososphaerota archaeon]
MDKRYARIGAGIAVAVAVFAMIFAYSPAPEKEVPMNGNAAAGGPAMLSDSKAGAAPPVHRNYTLDLNESVGMTAR